MDYVIVAKPRPLFDSAWSLAVRLTCPAASPPPSTGCCSRLKRANESSSPLTLTLLPALLAQGRPSNSQDWAAVCTNMQWRSCKKRGKRLTGGWGFNKRQPASALFGLQIIAGWCSIILQPEIAVERKVEGGGKEWAEWKGGGGQKKKKSFWNSAQREERFSECYNNL